MMNDASKGIPHSLGAFRKHLDRLRNQVDDAMIVDEIKRSKSIDRG